MTTPGPSITRIVLGAFIALLLVACGPSEAERRAAAQAAVAQRAEAEAGEQLRLYRQSAEAGNIELAAAYGELIKARYPQTRAASALGEEFAGFKAQAAVLKEQRRLEALWIYQTAPMRGGTQRTATLYSAETSGERLRLILRRHSAWGLSVFLLAPTDLFACDRCQVQIAFDQAEPQSFEASKASSKENPALFIDEEQRFIEAMDHARELRMQVPTFEGGRELRFEVSGYDPARFEAGE